MSEIRRNVSNLSPGTRYIARVRSYNKFNVVSGWSEAVNFNTPGDQSVPSAPTGLTVNFATSSLVIDWVAPTTNTDSSPIGDLASYEVTLTAGSSKIHRTTNIHFLYGFDQNVSDFGTPQGTIGVQVRAVDTAGNRSVPISATAQNPIPGNPSIAPDVIAAFTIINIFTKPDITIGSPPKDIGGYLIEHSLTGVGGWSALVDTADGSNNYVHEVDQGTTHYYRYKIRDVFGQYSASYSPVGSATTITVGEAIEDTNPPSVPGGLALSHGIDAVDQTPYIDVSWTANTETDLNYYELRLRKSGETVYSSVPKGKGQINHRFKNLQSSATYEIYIRAADSYGNYSDWSSVSSITVGAGNISWEPTSLGGLIISSAGYVKSANHVTNTSGWKLDSAGLEINQGAIKAAALLIGISSENHLRNASFENGTTVATNWSSVATGGAVATYSVSTDTALYQAKSQKIVLTTGGTTIGVVQTYTLPASIAIGTPVAVSFWAKQTVGTVRTPTIQAECLASAAVVQTQSSTAGVFILNTWKRHTLTFITTAIADQIRISLWVNSPAIGDTFYFEGAQLELSNFVSVFKPASLDIPDNYISSALISSLSADKFTGGTVDAATINVGASGFIQSLGYNGSSGYRLEDDRLTFQNGGIYIINQGGFLSLDGTSLRAVYGGNTKFQVDSTGVYIGGADATTAPIFFNTSAGLTTFKSVTGTHTFQISTDAASGNSATDKILSVFETASPSNYTFYLQNDGTGFFAKGIIGLGTAGGGGFNVDNTGNMWAGASSFGTSPLWITPLGELKTTFTGTGYARAGATTNNDQNMLVVESADFESLIILDEDTFDRVNSISAIGNPWTALRGTWGINSNAAYTVTDDPSSLANIAVYDTSADRRSSNGVVQVTFQTAPVTGQGVAFRVQDASNYWRVTVNTSSNTWEVRKCISGTETLVGNIGTAPITAGCVVSVYLMGASIAIRVNNTFDTTNTSPAGANFTSNDLSAENRHGLASTASGSTRWDKYQFCDLTWYGSLSGTIGNIRSLARAVAGNSAGANITVPAAPSGGGTGMLEFRSGASGAMILQARNDDFIVWGDRDFTFRADMRAAGTARTFRAVVKHTAFGTGTVTTFNGTNVSIGAAWSEVFVNIAVTGLPVGWLSVSIETNTTHPTAANEVFWLDKAQMIQGSGATTYKAPSVSDRYTQSVIADSPRLYWKLSDSAPGSKAGYTATDFSGNANHGVYTKNTGIVWNAGSLRQNTSNSATWMADAAYVQTNNDLSGSVVSQYTIEFWMLADPYAFIPLTPLVTIYRTGTTDVALQISYGTNYAGIDDAPYLEIKIGAQVLGTQQFWKAQKRIPGQHSVYGIRHIVVGFDLVGTEAVVSIFNNGQFVTDFEASYAIAAGSAGHVYGVDGTTSPAGKVRLYGGTASTFYFSDVAIYGSLLSVSQISRHYTEGGGFYPYLEMNEAGLNFYGDSTAPLTGGSSTLSLVPGEGLAQFTGLIDVENVRADKVTSKEITTSGDSNPISITNGSINFYSHTNSDFEAVPGKINAFVNNIGPFGTACGVLNIYPPLALSDTPPDQVYISLSENYTDGTEGYIQSAAALWYHIGTINGYHIVGANNLNQTDWSYAGIRTETLSNWAVFTAHAPTHGQAITFGIDGTTGQILHVRNSTNTAYIPIKASAFTVSSSELTKKNIRDYTPAEQVVYRKEKVTEKNISEAPPSFLETVSKMRPVIFNRPFHSLTDPSVARTAVAEKNESHDKIGFIAEEMEKLLPEACSWGPSGAVDGISYEAIVPVLVAAIQELREEVKSLRESK